MPFSLSPEPASYDPEEFVDGSQPWPRLLALKDGVFTARLYADSIRGERASLLRVAPGAKYPSHHHSHVEHCYVLQGDVVFSDHTLYAGDYEAAFGGTDHSAVTTHTGCLLFLIHNQNDEVYL